MPPKNKGKKNIRVRGICACPGTVVGVAVVVTNPTKTINVKRGVILVAEFTTPILATALSRAAGLVLARGGLTSHGAVIAREFGIPCVVGVTNALKLIKTGTKIKINATSGIVYETNNQR